MRSILLYHLMPATYWQDLTRSLLGRVPHDAIAIHVAMPWYKWPRRKAIERWLRAIPKVQTVLFSMNSRRRGESIGFDRLRREIDLSGFQIATYIHSKGVSRRRKNTQPIRDWTEAMRYFVVERHDLCIEAFRSGKSLYGIDLMTYVPNSDQDRERFADTHFVYAGNFVSINLEHLRAAFSAAACAPHYYGVERFWGKLCHKAQAHSAHQCSVDHYNEAYPPERYRMAERQPSQAFRC